MARPFVYVNMAATVDGKITSAAREQPRFASAADRRRMDRLRAEADAILVGAGTMRADDPPLHVRDDEMRRHRKSLGKPPALVRVLLTASGRIAADSRFFDDPDGGARIVATVENVAIETRGRAEVWRLGRERVDLVELLERLHARGIERLLVEGGGETNWCLLRDDLVDEINLTVAPTLLGGREAPTLLEGEGFAMDARRRLRLEALEREGDELFCRYAVLR